MKWAWPAALALMIFAAAIPSSPAAAQSNNIQITPEMIGPGTKVTVLIADGGLDANPNRADEYEAEDVELVTFATDRSEVGEAVPDLEETGENTGIFLFEIQLVTDGQECEDDDLGDAQFEAQDGSDPSIGVCPGDTLSIEYDDGNEVVSSSVTIRSWDPEFVADQESYVPGDRIDINITDPDANRDPDIADSIRDIKVSSDSDAVGERVSAIEIGENTGVFRLTFTISTHVEGNAVLVEYGDEVTVEYTDEFPADFTATTVEKTFILSISIPQDDSGLIGALRLSIPEITADGTPAAGKQAILSTVITNNNNQLQPFVGLVEVRDQDGVTVFLEW